MMMTMMMMMVMVIAAADDKNYSATTESNGKNCTINERERWLGGIRFNVAAFVFGARPLPSSYDCYASLLA